jgi:hypothetical protein
MEPEKRIYRQRRWQLKKLAEGNCPRCGKRRIGDAQLCIACMVKIRDAQRQRNGTTKTYNSLSRRLEKMLDSPEMPR